MVILTSRARVLPYLYNAVYLLSITVRALFSFLQGRNKSAHEDMERGDGSQGSQIITHITCQARAITGLAASACTLSSLFLWLSMNMQIIFVGLTLDRLELHDIGLPEGACAHGIEQLALTNPRWDDLRIAMSPTFCPDLQVIGPSLPSPSQRTYIVPDLYVSTAL